jgi:hypothetical protein
MGGASDARSSGLQPSLSPATPKPQAHPMPLGPCLGLNHRHCCPPLPPACAEPRPPCLIPPRSGPQPSLSPAMPKAQARPMPLGPRLGLNHRRCCPPLPPACAEPRPPNLIPPSLDLRPPHPRQEFHKSPRRPPLPLLPTATTTRTTSAASKPRGNRHRRTTSRGPPSPRRHRPCCLGQGGRGEGHRTQRPVATGIAQPRMVVSLPSSSLAGARWGGSAPGGG